MTTEVGVRTDFSGYGISASVCASVLLRICNRFAAGYGPAMQLAERDRDPSSPTDERSTEEGPALRDAAAVAKRAAADEADAALARERFRDGPVPSIEPDEVIVGHLTPGESVHDLRTRAILRSPGGNDALGYGGCLYLTSRRLVHLGQVSMSVQLTDIVETSIAGERLLLTLPDGEGIALDVDRPRLFRAQMAAALLELRG